MSEHISVSEFDTTNQSHIDYLFSNHECYTLDELKILSNIIDNKVRSSAFQKMIEYNIIDCVLVELIDNKLKFIEQVMGLAYDAKVNFNDTLTTVRMWDVIIHNYLMDNRIVIPPLLKKSADKTIIGGYVKEPRLGMSKWVVSLDLASLYPHLIMMYNISPDTLETKEVGWPSIEELLEQKLDIKKYDPSLTYSYAANGTVYKRDKQGFLAALMESVYTNRLKYKKLMIEAEKELELIEIELRKYGV